MRSSLLHLPPVGVATTFLHCACVSVRAVHHYLHSNRYGDGPVSAFYSGNGDDRARLSLLLAEMHVP
jgi:hypothetical protein